MIIPACSLFTVQLEMPEIKGKWLDNRCGFEYNTEIVNILEYL